MKREKCFSCHVYPAPYRLENKATCVGCMHEALHLWFNQQGDRVRDRYKKRLIKTFESPTRFREILSYAILRGFVKF